MATKRRGSKENPVTTQQLVDVILGKKFRDFQITDAAIKDDFCHYSYEVTASIGFGDRHSVKGKGIIKDTMKDAFGKLRVHLACIDDVFKNGGMEIGDIDTMHNDDKTLLYNVTGFKIKGSDEDQSIILIGDKYVSHGGRIALETPKIALDNLGGYKWYNELKAAADEVREQVALYKEGNYIAVEEDDTVEDPKQSKLSFVEGGKEDNMEDFESAQL